MSLENSIAELTAAITTNNELLRQVLAADEAKGGDTADKPKTTRAKKADKPAETGTETSGEATGTGSVDGDLKALKEKLSKWLGEFAKEEDKAKPDGAHPEVGARKDALQKAFKQLGVENLKGVSTAEQIAKLNAWHTKALGVDKGFGTGRFVADPVETTDEGEEDGLDI